ncbi:hypothetical protein Clacol_004340 [Clathrus columnatus]|uniref:Uncharacterized protein n=1 Tax=Clathrus columnatus TaxID=1419009 RepID=A0AAV5AA62_9AGAM|nr:hypothetical protein Clacol_004340 [Clathrus columnatus]
MNNETTPEATIQLVSEGLQNHPGADIHSCYCRKLRIGNVSLCDELAIVGNTITIFPLIGVQAYISTLLLVGNIANVLTDFLAFFGVLHQVWGLWKEKKRLHLHTDKDFVTLLFQQGILRFSLNDFGSSQISPVKLSAILICEFTLALRRRNTTRPLPNQSGLELPDLNMSFQQPMRSIHAVVGHLHESIIADMGERNNNPVNVNGLGQPEEPNQQCA